MLERGEDGGTEMIMPKSLCPQDAEVLRRTVPALERLRRVAEVNHETNMVGRVDRAIEAMRALAEC
jgi:hypothetical protein